MCSLRVDFKNLFCTYICKLNLVLNLQRMKHFEIKVLTFNNLKIKIYKFTYIFVYCKI